jgi:6-phosphogluconolactonase
VTAASTALARELLGRARRSVAARGRFSWVISGGRTPQELYRILATRYRRAFPWAATEVFFADERCVPAGDPESNFGAAWRTLLSHVPIPRARIHRLRGELRPPGEAARRYARLLRPRASAAHRPRAPFDLVLLGIGPDGHTASLFPGDPAVRERRRSVVSVRRPGLPPYVPRLTLTPPALSSAREVWFLVGGADKAAALAGIFRAGAHGSRRFPASRIRPKGATVWFLDRQAAAGLASAGAGGTAA